MIDRPHVAQARCGECGAAYRISNVERSYVCKACGGAVVAVGERRAPVAHEGRDGAGQGFDDLATCNDCQALNHPGAHFCAECGAVLDDPSASGARDASAPARHETAHALKGGYRWLLGVTWLYRLGALAYAALTTVAVVALTRTDVPLMPGLVVVTLMTALTVAMLIGALQIPFRPFAWTVTVAILATLATVVHLFGPNPLGLAILWSTTWAALLWAALYPTLRLKRLIEQHTDEYILHHASLQTRHALAGRSPEQRHERLQFAMHRAAGRAWKLSAMAGVAVVALSALGTRAVLTKLRPQDFGEARERFERAWDASDLDAIGALLPPEVRDQKVTWLEGISEGHGWTEGLPPLPEGARREAELVWIDYELGDLTMSAGWGQQALEWFVLDIELPRPALRDAVDRLVEAWENSDADRIAAFFPATHVERYRESIGAAASKRDWSSYPQVLGVDVDEKVEDESLVTLRIPHGEVGTKWRFRLDGKWGLQAISFPPLRAYRKARESGGE